MVEGMSAASEEARKWADLASNPRVAAPLGPPLPVQGPEEDPETYFERVAALRLLAEPCDG